MAFAGYLSGATAQPVNTQDNAFLEQAVFAAIALLGMFLAFSHTEVFEKNIEQCKISFKKDERMSKISGISMKVSSGASSRAASRPPQGGGGGAGKGAAASLASSLNALNAATGKKSAGHIGTKISKYA